MFVGLNMENLETLVAMDGCGIHETLVAMIVENRGTFVALIMSNYKKLVEMIVENQGILLP